MEPILLFIPMKYYLSRQTIMITGTITIYDQNTKAAACIIFSCLFNADLFGNFKLQRTQCAAICSCKGQKGSFATRSFIFSLSRLASNLCFTPLWIFKPFWLVDSYSQISHLFLWTDSLWIFRSSSSAKLSPEISQLLLWYSSLWL